MIDGFNENEEKKTTLNLSLSVDDKVALKMMAAEQSMTVSALIHSWIVERKEDE